MKPEFRDFPDLDTPAVPLPHVECTCADCPNPGVNMALVDGVYKLRCALHTPTPPPLVPPESQ